MSDLWTEKSREISPNLGKFLSITLGQVDCGCVQIVPQWGKSRLGLLRLQQCHRGGPGGGCASPFRIGQIRFDYKCQWGGPGGSAAPSIRIGQVRFNYNSVSGGSRGGAAPYFRIGQAKLDQIWGNFPKSREIILDFSKAIYHIYMPPPKTLLITHSPPSLFGGCGQRQGILA